MPEIVRASVLDAFDLAGSLREPDKAELAAHDRTPIDGLLASLEASKVSWLIHHEGEALALFGAGDCTFGDGIGAPWLLGSEALVTTHRRWFIRNTRRIITAPDPFYSRYFNFVDARNTVHVRWLRWAGFMVLPAVPWGPFRLPFHPFYRKVQAHV